MKTPPLGLLGIDQETAAAQIRADPMGLPQACTHIHRRGNHWPPSQIRGKATPNHLDQGKGQFRVASSALRLPQNHPICKQAIPVQPERTL